MANNQTPMQRLGNAVQARRHELGLSQIEVWHNGGPSNSTLTGIENGVARTVSGATLAKLDRSLGWEPGTAYRVLTGHDPVSTTEVVQRTDLRASKRARSREEVDNRTSGMEVRLGGEVVWSLRGNPIPPNQLWEHMLALSSEAKAARSFESGRATKDELLAAVARVQETGMDVVHCWLGGSEGAQSLREALGIVLTPYEHAGNKGRKSAAAALQECLSSQISDETPTELEFALQFSRPSRPKRELPNPRSTVEMPRFNRANLLAAMSEPEGDREPDDDPPVDPPNDDFEGR